MNDWKRQTADETGATGNALIDFGGAMRRNDIPDIRVKCTQLRSSVDKLERTLPSPDKRVNTALEGGIDDFRSLSRLCMTLTAMSSKEEMREMGALLDSGSKHMNDAFKLMGLNTP